MGQEQLYSFVPARVLTLCERSWRPQKQVFKGVAVFADISGFTPLTERLQREAEAKGFGPGGGAEILVAFLNDYFGTLVNLVREYGGDVVKFAGDALLAVWPGVDSADAPLPDLVRSSIQCSLAIQV